MHARTYRTFVFIVSDRLPIYTYRTCNFSSDWHTHIRMHVRMHSHTTHHTHTHTHTHMRAHDILHPNILIFSPPVYRELTELVTEVLPFNHLSSECHCPPSLPLIDPNNENNCIPHAGLTPRAPQSRIGTSAHPPGFVNNLGSADSWISALGGREASLTITLTNSLYEVKYARDLYLCACACTYVCDCACV